MNSVNPKFSWISFVSATGILFAAVALFGIATIKRNDLYDLHVSDGRLNMILLFTAATWIGELVCGILILKRHKILGQILIAIGVFIFFLYIILPAHT